MNYIVMLRSVKNFIFWIKMLVSIEASICEIYTRHAVFHRSHAGDFLHLIGEILSTITFWSLIALYSTVDALENKLMIKTLGTLCTLAVIGAAVNYTFIEQDEDEESVIYIGSRKMSVFFLYGSAYRVLSIFMLKQTIFMFFKKRQCINIRHSPTIKWVD